MNFQPAFNGMGLINVSYSQTNQFVAEVFMNDRRVDVYIDGQAKSCTPAKWDELLETHLAPEMSDFDVALQVWAHL